MKLDDWIIGPDHVPRQVGWGEYLRWRKGGPGQKRVAEDRIGEAWISTVFLTVDHQFGDGPPILFETMIFGGPYADAQWRYATWDEAVAGHARVVTALRDGIDPDADR
jgi:hypothetical protein